MAIDKGNDPPSGQLATPGSGMRAFGKRLLAVLRALIRKGFTELGVQRVVAETMAVNTRSRRVMEKIGLRHVRTFFVDWPDPLPGSDQGEVEYALTRAEFFDETDVLD